MRATLPGWFDKNLLAVLKVLVAVIAIAAFLLALRSDRYVVDAPITEDAYYMLSVARNIAMGNGLTVDGVNPTNGFQPLFTFLSALAVKLAGADRYLAVRYVTILEWLLYISTAYLVGLIGRDLLPREETEKRSLMFWLSIFVYLASLFVFAVHFNGLETGCLLFFIGLAWRYYQVIALRSLPRIIAFGAILGLVVLVRIDAVFLVLVLVSYQFWSSRKQGVARAAGRAMVLGGTAFVVSLPWWLYNLLQFGSLIPSSGTAQELWQISVQRLAAAFAALVQTWTPFIYLSRFDGILLLIKVLFVMGIIAFWIRRRDQLPKLVDPGRSAHLRRTVEFALCLIISMSIVVLWYTLSSLATYFYARYFAPAVLPATLVLSYTLLQVKMRWLLALISVAGTFVLVLTIVIASTGAVSSFRGNTNYVDQLQLVNKYVPANEVVASGQTGTLGYFRDHVVNLDGKVNAEALLFRSNMWQYLQRNEIKWFCDWPQNALFFLGESPEDHGWNLVASQGLHALYHFEGTP